MFCRIPISRRGFVAQSLSISTACVLSQQLFADDGKSAIGAVPANSGEDLFQFINRTMGQFDETLYRQLLGSANEYKEGDESIGVAADNDLARRNARQLLANTRISQLLAHPIFVDTVSEYIDSAVDRQQRERVEDWTIGQLKTFLLQSSESEIATILPGLPSDVIACVVKLMSNQELIAASQKIFHPLPNSRIGARGYLSARVQPNSPTDHVDDIRWQVFNAWAYAVGDLLLGTNPVSSDVDSVTRVEQALADILKTFGLESVLPHCVLAHIDVQDQVEERVPGSTALWFQSLAGCTTANATFDLTVEKMVSHAAKRTGPFALYFETGQGADATNGHGHGFDMVIHESRNYGFARALTQEVRRARLQAGKSPDVWVHVNDVAGFIGPEVFRTREQLVRCCLEDTLMGKLHGLTIGLDICSTLHMEVDLDDLDWCIDQVMPANPAYLMALPTKNDPMLSYLTTAFQDHVRIREKFGYKVDDRMWHFFQEIGIIDAQGKPTEHFGRPEWVYLQYRRRAGDTRSEVEVFEEAARLMNEVEQRGVTLVHGRGRTWGELAPAIDRRVRDLYADAKRSIWAELPNDFVQQFPAAMALTTQSADRRDYILHPPTGEVLSADSVSELQALREESDVTHNVQIIVTDGLNALSLTDPGHLPPFLDKLRGELQQSGWRTSERIITVRNGRVRAGYRIGEQLFGRLSDDNVPCTVVHVIGERPGSGHHAYSVYVTKAPVSTWRKEGSVDHNITRVVSGIADTALDPAAAASEVARIMGAGP